MQRMLGVTSHSEVGLLFNQVSVTSSGSNAA